MPSAGNDVGSASPRSLGGALQGPRIRPVRLARQVPSSCLRRSSERRQRHSLPSARRWKFRGSAKLPATAGAARQAQSATAWLSIALPGDEEHLGTGGKRKPGDESRIVFLAIIQDIFRPAVRKAVAVLDTHNGHDLGTVCLPARIGQGSPRKKEKRNNHTSDAIRKTWGKKSPFGRVWPYSLL